MVGGYGKETVGLRGWLCIVAAYALENSQRVQLQPHHVLRVDRAGKALRDIRQTIRRGVRCQSGVRAREDFGR